jgi:dCTP deaminase
MTLMNDRWIIKQVLEYNMITPFVDEQVKHNASGEKGISYGVSSFGYDTRAAAEWKLVKSIRPWSNDGVLDPKSVNADNWEPEIHADSFVIPPHGFVLTRSLEYFRIPNDVACIVLGKSTYARLGLIVNATPLEPAWEGHITLELTNSTPLPVRVYGNEGIAQVLFFKGEDAPITTYASKGGKYQYQEGIVMARM